MDPERVLRVLIAENHRDLSDVMTELINSEPGMRCVGQVSSAHEVIDRARQSNADALVLDLMLHGGSGMTLIEELVSELPGIRVIVFSGFASDELARETKRRGAAAFVTKGCDFNVLMEEIRGGAADDPPARASA